MKLKIKQYCSSEVATDQNLDFYTKAMDKIINTS